MASKAPYNPWRTSSLDSTRIEAENSRLETEVRRMQELLEQHKTRLATADSKTGGWKSAKPPKSKPAADTKGGSASPRVVVLTGKEPDRPDTITAPSADRSTLGSAKSSASATAAALRSSDASANNASSRTVRVTEVTRPSRGGDRAPDEGGGSVADGDRASAKRGEANNVQPGAGARKVEKKAVRVTPDAAVHADAAAALDGTVSRAKPSQRAATTGEPESATTAVHVRVPSSGDVRSGDARAASLKRERSSGTATGASAAGDAGTGRVKVEGGAALSREEIASVPAAPHGEGNATRAQASKGTSKKKKAPVTADAEGRVTSAARAPVVEVPVAAPEPATDSGHVSAKKASKLGSVRLKAAEAAESSAGGSTSGAKATPHVRPAATDDVGAVPAKVAKKKRKSGPSDTETRVESPRARSAAADPLLQAAADQDATSGSSVVDGSDAGGRARRGAPMTEDRAASAVRERPPETASPQSPPVEATHPHAHEVPAAPQVPESEVARWLSSLNIRDVGKYAALFEQHEVDMDSLGMVTESQLREMGVAAIGTLNKLVAGIEALRRKLNPPPAEPPAPHAPPAPVATTAPANALNASNAPNAPPVEVTTDAPEKGASLTRKTAKDKAPSAPRAQKPPRRPPSDAADSPRVADDSPSSPHDARATEAPAASKSQRASGGRIGSASRPPPVPRVSSSQVRAPRAALQPAILDLGFGVGIGGGEGRPMVDDSSTVPLTKKADAAPGGDGLSHSQHAAEIGRLVDELRGQSNRLGVGRAQDERAAPGSDGERAAALERTSALIKALEAQVVEGKFAGADELSAFARSRIEANDRLIRRADEELSAIPDTHSARPDFEIAEEEVHVVEGSVLGSGAFAEVFRGMYRGTDVAVKRLRASVDGKHHAYFLSEAAMLYRLRHPNIILFLGACTASRRPTMVLEFMSGGSLYDLIHRRKGSPWLDDHVTFHKIARDIAQGMNFLHMHRPPIVHRDLKSPNVLLDSSGTAKISDFGFSRLKLDAAATISGGLRGTPAWLAPEAFEGKAMALTTKADVYAYGIILWEMASRRKPFEGLSMVEIMTTVRSGTRPVFAADCPAGLSSLAAKCWHQQPSARPEFSNVLADLDALVFPPEWRALFAQAGIRQDEIADPATAMFVVDLVGRSVCAPSPIAAGEGAAKAPKAPKSVARDAGQTDTPPKRALSSTLQQAIRMAGGKAEAAKGDGVSASSSSRPPRASGQPPVSGTPPAVRKGSVGAAAAANARVETLLDEISAGKQSLRPTSGPKSRQLADLKALPPAAAADLTSILKAAFEKRRGAIRESEPSLASSAPGTAWTAAL